MSQPGEYITCRALDIRPNDTILYRGSVFHVENTKYLPTTRTVGLTLTSSITGMTHFLKVDRSERITRYYDKSPEDILHHSNRTRTTRARLNREEDT